MKLLGIARNKTKKFKRFTRNKIDMIIGREVMAEYELKPRIESTAQFKGILQIE